MPCRLLWNRWGRSWGLLFVFLFADRFPHTNADPRPDGIGFCARWHLAELRRFSDVLRGAWVHDRLHSQRRGAGVGERARCFYCIPWRGIGWVGQLGVGRWERLGGLYATEYRRAPWDLRDKACNGHLREVARLGEWRCTPEGAVPDELSVDSHGRAEPGAYRATSVSPNAATDAYSES